MITVTRPFDFCAAHVLDGHEKCGRIHGHNYHVEVTIARRDGTMDGMVMDFKRLDEFVKPVIEDMDHRFLVSNNNIEVGNVWAIMARELEQDCPIYEDFSTAECLAAAICRTVDKQLPPGYKVMEVSVWETPKSKATYTPK